MDEQSKELVKAAAEGVAAGATSQFLDKLLGPLVEAGGLLRDHVRFRRWKADVKMLEKAQAFLEDRGIDPSRVPAKILFPLLDYASLEDEADEVMLDRWAALLANAAAGTERGATVLPSFPRILSELSPEEAATLDKLYREPDPERVPSMYLLHADYLRLGRDEDPLFYTRCFNLDRLGLLDASWENVLIHDTNPRAYRHTVARLEGTALGLSFVLACRPPGERSLP
jgi:hypothetical protein